MKKSSSCIRCSTMVLFMVLASCGMGLDPAKSDTGSVVLSIPAVAANASAPGGGRAIIPYGGYLYVRMIGGPTADSPSFLGPFRVSGTMGATINIPGIPAGSYDGMFVLYAATEVHKEESGTDYGLFSNVLLLPDDEFVALVEGDPLATVPDDLDRFFNGRASFGVVENAVIRAGTTNIFSIPMEPITPHWVDFLGDSDSLLDIPNPPANGFFVNCFGYDLASGPSFDVYVGNDSGGTFTVTRIAVYREDGSLLRMNYPLGYVVGEGVYTPVFHSTYHSGEDIYVYVGYSGEPTEIQINAAFNGLP